MSLLFPFSLSGKHNPYGSLPEDYLVLYSLVAAIKPRVILEAGTHAGISACVMAHAGKEYGFPLTVHTTDTNARGDHRKSARQLAHRLFRPGKVKFYDEDSTPFLLRMSEPGVDLVFIDAGHSYIEVATDFEAVAGRSRFVLLHDSVQTPGVAKFVAGLRYDDSYSVVNLPTRSTSKRNGRVVGMALIEYLGEL